MGSEGLVFTPKALYSTAQGQHALRAPPWETYAPLGEPMRHLGNGGEDKTASAFGTQGGAPSVLTLGY